MSLRILIAERDDTIRDEIARALDGHEVCEASSAEEALEALQRDDFPLILTNISLDGTCGRHLMQRARSLAPDALVVVMIPGAETSAARDAIRAGADDCLAVPCEDFLLEAVLARAHERVRFSREKQDLLQGDALLVTLARLIQKASRESTVVARYGGEEFVLLVPETDRGGARAYANKLRSIVEAYPFPGCRELPGGRITMSFGVAVFPEDGADTRSLLRRADQALYRAKDSGRNSVQG